MPNPIEINQDLSSSISSSVLARHSEVAIDDIHVPPDDNNEEFGDRCTPKIIIKRIPREQLPTTPYSSTAITTEETNFNVDKHLLLLADDIQDGESKRKRLKTKHRAHQDKDM